MMRMAHQAPKDMEVRTGQSNVPALYRSQHIVDMRVSIHSSYGSLSIQQLWCFQHIVPMGLSIHSSCGGLNIQQLWDSQYIISVGHLNKQQRWRSQYILAVGGLNTEQPRGCQYIIAMEVSIAMGVSIYNSCGVTEQRTSILSCYDLNTSHLVFILLRKNDYSLFHIIQTQY